MVQKLHATKSFYMNPAHRIITMFGGPAKLGRLLNLHRSTVWRWQVSSENRREGRNGVIPAELQQRLIDLAKSELNQKLSREDFFPTYERASTRSVENRNRAA